MRVALIHYWLVNMRGGEKVLESLCRMYPQADIYTHVVAPENLSALLREHLIRTTFINHLPGSVRHYQKYLPLMPLALEQIDLRAYDLVISSESGPAKGVLTRADTPHVCYCHSPMRYLWDFYQDYMQHAGRMTRLAMRPVFHRLRLWDVASAGRVDKVIANSNTVARRVGRWWRREAAVVHPPVDVDRYAGASSALPGIDAPYLCLGQLVPYKRVDVAVEACTRTGRRLVVAGEGADRGRLERLAGPTVTFLGRIDDEQAARLYAQCRALLFPGEEDFGMVPVEAQAAGRPVIAYGRGGALETVLEGETGLFFPEQNVASLIAALDRFEQSPPFDPAVIKAHAARFSEARFHQEMRIQIDAAMDAVREGKRILP